MHSGRKKVHFGGSTSSFVWRRDATQYLNVLNVTRHLITYLRILNACTPFCAIRKHLTNISDTYIIRYAFEWTGTDTECHGILRYGKIYEYSLFVCLFDKKGAPQLSGQASPSTQVTAPRGPFPHAGSTSPGWATTTYTQTTPLRAEVVPGAAWSRRRTRDRRPHRSKQEG
jgi:hypothetical protein